MNIFESLENLNVSEECFDDIIGLVEEELEKVGFKGYKGPIMGEPNTDRAKHYRRFSRPKDRDKAESIVKKAEALDNKLERQMKADKESDNSKVKGEAERREESLKNAESMAYSPYRAGQGRLYDKTAVLRFRRPEYNHYKDIGTKAIKGHYFDNTHNLKEDPGAKLYRIGKKIEQHKNK